MLRFQNFRRIILPVLFILFILVNNTFAQNVSDKSGYSARLIQRAENILHPNVFNKISKSKRLSDNLTMIKLEAKRNWNILTPEAKTFFLKIMQQPDWLKKSYTSAGGFFRVWYNTGSDKDAVSPTTDANGNGIPDLVEYCANALDLAYSKYTLAGLVMPYPVASNNTRPPFIKTKYEVYLTNSDNEGSYGSVTPEVTIGDNPNSTTVVEQNSASSFMELRSSYIDFGEANGDTTIANLYVKVTTAHEFMHSVQMGYNENMSAFVMEMCATYSESWSYPTLYDNFQYTDEFGRPDVALDYDNSEEITDYDDHWYASWWYMRYLTDQYGQALTKTVYEGLLTNDYIPVFNSILQPNGLDFISSVKNFFISNALMSSKTVCQPYTYTLADAYRSKFDELGMALTYEKTFTYSGSDINYNSATGGNGVLMRLGADYFTITPSQNFSVKLTPAHQSDSLALILLKTDAAINPSKLSVVQASKTGNDYTINVTDKSQYSNFILIVVNVKTARDGESSDYTLKISTASTTSTYSISGVVRDNNSAPISGADVSLSGGSQATVTSGTNGAYSFSNLTSGLNYIVTPVKTGYTFAPAQGTFNNLSKNETQDFVGTAPVIKYTISGKVKDNSGNGIANTTLTLGGGAQATVTTGSDGTYSFSNLTSGLNYTVAPAKTGYTFVPTQGTFNNLSKNETQDFVGTAPVIKYTISGKVKDNSGNGIANTTLTLGGGAQATVTTGSDGSYSFSNLTSGLNYTVAPAKTGYTFVPTQGTFNNLSKNETQDFIGTEVVIKYTISGIVKDNSGNGIANAAVTLGGGSQATVNTGSDGTYSFSNLTSGLNYTVTPVKTGYTFVPTQGTFNNLSKNETQDFIGTEVVIKYTISGIVKDNSGNGIANAAVTLSGGSQATVTTGSDGTYSFSNLTSGLNYTVTPVKTDYTFVPALGTFNNLSKNETQDFVGTFVPRIFKIEGYTKNKDNTPLKDVLLNLSGGKTSYMKTESDGYYKFENLEANKSYTITPVYGQVEFEPSSKTYDNLSGNQLFTFLTKVQVGIFGINNLPDGIMLYSNYPNPFNPSTNIRYEINESMKVKIQIYNSAGNLISNLYEGVQSAGMHEIQFDASNVATGTYFVKLITPTATRSISINLIK